MSRVAYPETVPTVVRYVRDESGNLLQVKRAHFNGSADGNLVAAVGGKKILVLSIWAEQQHGSDAAVNIFFNDSAGDDLIDTAPKIRFTKDGDGAVFGWNPGGWFETEAQGEGIDIDVSAAVTCDVQVLYVEVT